jgi:predicted nucleic acid-binding protein
VERDVDGRLLVVADSSFLINFLALDRLDILAALRQFRFHVLDHVLAEIRYEEQRRRLEAGMQRKVVEPLEIEDLDEIRLYDEFRQVLGDGEAACLAVAVNRRWLLAADEKGRFQRELFGRLGESYLLNTLGALVTAVQVRVLTIGEGEELREQLRRHRFDTGSRPLNEFLGEGETGAQGSE